MIGQVWNIVHVLVTLKSERHHQQTHTHTHMYLNGWQHLHQTGADWHAIDGHLLTFQVEKGEASIYLFKIVGGGI
jgi:hypothetical protein